MRRFWVVRLKTPSLILRCLPTNSFDFQKSHHFFAPAPLLHELIEYRCRRQRFCQTTQPNRAASMAQSYKMEHRATKAPSHELIDKTKGRGKLGRSTIVDAALIILFINALRVCIGIYRKNLFQAIKSKLLGMHADPPSMRPPTWDTPGTKFVQVGAL